MASIAVFLSHVRQESKLADIVEQHIERDFIGLVRVFSSSDQTSIVGSRWLDDVTKALLTRFRVLTDLTGDFNRVILGYEADSVAEFQARMRD